MPEIEDDLQVQNWLSISTFDLFKYTAVGGELLVQETEAGLVLTLPGVSLSSKGINKKFGRFAQDAIQNEPVVV